MLNLRKDLITVRDNPDKPNIFIEVRKKPSNLNIWDCMEAVYEPLIDELNELGSEFPVTLCYMPVEWCVEAQNYAVTLFGIPELYSSRYAIVFSSQDQKIITHVLSQLKLEDPFLRLVFTSPFVGCGFDSPCTVRTVHGKPTRKMVDLLQQVGRAGRLGQKSSSVVYFNANDIASNVEGMSDEMRDFCNTDGCYWLFILKQFGYDHRKSDVIGCECCSNCKPKCTCISCN